MIPTQIYLIRHGESVWNETGRVQGWGDPALSRRGLRQARAVARRLSEVSLQRVEAARRFADRSLQRIYASPLRRAHQTALRISQMTGIPIQPVADFREVGLGAWEGKPVKWLRQRHPALYDRWLRTPSKARIPDGEGIVRFQRRVLEAFHAVLDESDHDAMVAIVTHGGVIRAILAHVLGIPFDPLMCGISLGNTSITQLAHTRGRLAIVVLNDTAHLNGSWPAGRRQR